MISIPILLLVVGGISFWLLVQSDISWVFKNISILAFCFLIVNLFYSISSFLGWPTLSRDLPERVRIVAVQIKEPSIFQSGGIYLMLDSVRSKYDKKMLELFGYKPKLNEPRLFGLPYSRKFHEQLEKEVIPKIREGQIVEGKIGKAEKSGEGEGKNGKNNSKGKGSESQEQEFKFYNLKPGEIQQK